MKPVYCAYCGDPDPCTPVWFPNGYKYVHWHCLKGYRERLRQEAETKQKGGDSILTVANSATATSA